MLRLSQRHERSLHSAALGVLAAALGWPLPAAAQANPPAAEAIIPDAEFEAAIPALSTEDDPALSGPLESIDAFERRIDPQTGPVAVPGEPVADDHLGGRPVGAATIRDAELTRPLPPLESFKVEPTAWAEADSETRPDTLRYEIAVNGLDQAGLDEAGLSDGFDTLSALRRGNGKAANAAQVSSRAAEDVLLLKKLLAAGGWYDAQVGSRIDRAGPDNTALRVTFDVNPGKRFALASVRVDAAPTVPAGLVNDNLLLRPGEPVIAAQVLAAEARIALALPENGYPFAEVGQREIVLDPDSGEADYTLPVEIGPRGSHGAIVSAGTVPFGADHVAVLARFRPGEVYDSRMVDDLRQALIATGLFKGIGIEPRRTGRPGPDGTEVVDLVVTQEAGPPRVIAGTAGYSTGQGFRAEASWTHRNLFPPEGALIVGGVVGTQEQGAGVVFRRSNAGKRDRTFELAAELQHAGYDAYSAYTGRLSARVSYDSTPLWQKRLTYAYGGQVLGTNESVYDFAAGRRVRRTYAVAGLNGQLGLDTTDSLLEPTEGFRLTALVEPEGSLNGAFSPYVRVRLDGSAYYGVTDSLVLAGRLKVATIQGVALDDLAPSRRLYAGGGGSVRGFAYQALGPRDPANDPTGARSLNEAAFELRYRFGDYGVVAFADVGQSYASPMPSFADLRVGVGLGARFYTNFGPMRLDIATPLRRKDGESLINVYVSIGQAF